MYKVLYSAIFKNKRRHLRSNMHNISHLKFCLLTKFIHLLLIYLLVSTSVSAQTFNKIIPMGEWLEHEVITYSGEPVVVHLRTGYESAVTFPEPTKLYAVDSRLVSSQYSGTLPGCDIEIHGRVMRLSPLKRMRTVTVAVRGTDSGTIYELLVSSSPTGSRQPVDLSR